MRKPGDLFLSLKQVCSKSPGVIRNAVNMLSSQAADYLDKSPMSGLKENYI
ncbi:MAG: hypothetical protein JW967_09770 [Dehalococcoidales bacterium]|nr:hypothetical protein [Dehalococcoidales bacterium]